MKTKLWLGCLYLMAGIHLSMAQAVKPESDNTVVTSDQFKLDMNQRQGLFTGNVNVTGKDFKLKAAEMTVFFGVGNNRVERLIAKGDAVIEQPDRTAKCTQVEYLVLDDKMILSGSPEIVQNRNKITGNTIVIYRGSNKMEIDGRSRVVLYENIGNPTGAK
jgi:lipopolysaccharide export system protein LptA